MCPRIGVTRVSKASRHRGHGANDDSAAGHDRRSGVIRCHCAVVSLAGWRPRQAQDIAPVIVVETSKGTFAFETFPSEAPMTVAHIVELVKSGFYDGQRVHRALPGFVVQFGDPQTRDLGEAGAVGPRGRRRRAASRLVSPRSRRSGRTGKGAVGVAHLGDPAKADSQIYITLAHRPDLDGQYAVFGQVVDGADVPALLEVGDVISRVFVKP